MRTNNYETSTFTDYRRDGLQVSSLSFIIFQFSLWLICHFSIGFSSYHESFQLEALEPELELEETEETEEPHLEL